MEINWLKKHAQLLAEAAFEQYKIHGKGLLKIDLKPGIPPKFEYILNPEINYNPYQQTAIQINDIEIICSYDRERQKTAPLR